MQLKQNKIFINIKIKKNVMETNARLYTLNYSQARTYLMAAIFVGCNIVLPQLFHLIPQGGFIFAPLSLVILAGAYKFGWRAALLAAALSPLVNHLLFSQPSWAVLPVMTLKLVVIALVAGLVAERTKSVSLLLLAGVVLAAECIGGLGELLLTGGVDATVADFTIGWPGLLLQVFGTYLLLKKLPV